MTDNTPGTDGFVWLKLVAPAIVSLALAVLSARRGEWGGVIVFVGAAFIYPSSMALVEGTRPRREP